MQRMLLKIYNRYFALVSYFGAISRMEYILSAKFTELVAIFSNHQNTLSVPMIDSVGTRLSCFPSVVWEQGHCYRIVTKLFANREKGLLLWLPINVVIIHR